MTINKLPWPKQQNNGRVFAFNPRKHDNYIITDEQMTTGTTQMDHIAATKIAPLITINGIKFETIPFDGDVSNTSRVNVLFSGPGKRLGLDEQSARENHILRLEYDPQDHTYSYIYKENGANHELRYKKFTPLRRRIADSPHLKGLRNKKYLLTADEYSCLYEAFIAGQITEKQAKFNILDYKFDEIQ